MAKGKMYYSEEEAAEMLGTDVAGLTDLVRQKQLRLFKDGAKNMYMASEVDALAPGGAADEDAEVELTPVEDLADLSQADELSLGGKEDTVITAEGISIFDDEDLEIESADPMAKTQVTASISDDVTIEGGSGSGLLDLTRESDDTSLGEVIDHIDLDEAGAETAEAPAGTFTDIPMPAEAGMVVVAAAPTKMDASSGLFSGMLVATMIVMILVGVTALAAGAGVVPSFIAGLKENIAAAAGGSAVLVIVFGVIGFFIGKSIADKQSPHPAGN